MAVELSQLAIHPSNTTRFLQSHKRPTEVVEVIIGIEPAETLRVAKSVEHVGPQIASLPPSRDERHDHRRRDHCAKRHASSSPTSRAIANIDVPA